MSEKAKKKFKLLIGFCLVSLGFVIHAFYYGRLILIFIGLLYLIFGTGKKYRKRVIRKRIVIAIAYIAVLLVADTALAFTLKIEPVFAVYYKSDNIKIFNAIGYRVWQCQNGKKELDLFYKKAYLCNKDQIKTFEINAFSSQIVNNYDEYDNQFIKIQGKISQINGLNDLEMQAYYQQDNAINGYVLFTSDVTLRVNFNKTQEVLTNYELYDIVTVIGRIDNINKNADKTIINMVDSQIINDDCYQDFKLSLASEEILNEKITNTYSSGELQIWNMFSNPIMIKFSNQDVYELEFVLSSNKLSIDKLLVKAERAETNYEQTIKAYYFSNFKIFTGQKGSGQVIVIAKTTTDFEEIQDKF